MKKIIFTPIAFIAILLEIYLLLSGVYFLTIGNEKGNGMIGILSLISFFIIGFLIFVEQTIANKVINIKALWTIEIIAIIGGAIYLAVN